MVSGEPALFKTIPVSLDITIPRASRQADRTEACAMLCDDVRRSPVVALLEAHYWLVIRSARARISSTFLVQIITRPLA